jgi:hypothetical protein
VAGQDAFIGREQGIVGPVAQEGVAGLQGLSEGHRVFEVARAGV